MKTRDLRVSVLRFSHVIVLRANTFQIVLSHVVMHIDPAEYQSNLA
jgi:hypothetical protein